jgi:glycosyltransferase involved in cell wall biosynthesis
MSKFNEVDISFIIATLNRENELKECVTSIINGNFSRKYRIEIIIVDQSEDISDFTSTLDVPITVLKHQKGASASRNYGATFAKGNFLFFIDDDAKIISIKTEFIFDTKCNVYFFEWLEKPYKPKKLPFFRKINILRKSGTTFYVVNRKLFNLVSGFNESFGPGKLITACEDLDLLLRIDKVKKIYIDSYIGYISHPLNDNLIKYKSYQYSRGFILAANREYALIVFEIIFSLYKFITKLDSRVANVIRGIIESK